MNKTGKCALCGVVFEIHPKTRVQRFCSQACRITKWTNDNREQLNSNVRRYRARRYAAEGRWRDSGQKAVALKAWMVELKSKPCADCGSTFPICCMDFDHRDESSKAYNIGSMFAHHYSRELIQTEVDKCDLVCANCHRIRTRNKRTGNGKYKAYTGVCGVPKTG